MSSLSFKIGGLEAFRSNQPGPIHSRARPNFGYSGPGCRLFGLVAASYSAVVIDGSANAFTELNSVQIHTSAVQVVKYSISPMMMLVVEGVQCVSRDGHWMQRRLHLAVVSVQHAVLCFVQSLIVQCKLWITVHRQSCLDREVRESNQSYSLLPLYPAHCTHTAAHSKNGALQTAKLRNNADST